MDLDENTMFEVRNAKIEVKMIHLWFIFVSLTFENIIKVIMTQEERWILRYNEVKSFIEEHHRNPSKYAAEERLMVHFLKRGRKMLNAGELAEPRFSKFLELLELSEQNKHVNQWA